MAWWPWRRPGDEPARAAGVARGVAPVAEPVVRSGDWAELSPVQRVLDGPVAPVAPLDAFRASLATSHDPSFLAPLTHAVDPSTGGLVDGIAGPAGPRVRPLGPELAVPPRPPTSVPRVQRWTASWSSPSEAALAPAAAAPPHERSVGSAEPDASPEAVASGESTPVPEPTGPPLPSRTLAAVTDPGPLRSERPRLPVPELPVVSRLAAGPRPPARPPVEAGGTPTPERPAESAPLSGFAAAIAAIGGHEEPPALATDGPSEPTPFAPAVTGPAGPTTVTPGAAGPGPSEPSVSDAVLAPADQPLLGGPPPDLDPVDPDLPDLASVGSDQQGPTGVAAPAFAPEPVGPASVDPELPVVSRSVDLGAAHPLPVPSARAVSRSVPTLGTASGTPVATSTRTASARTAPAPSATAPGATAPGATAPSASVSPVLQRRVETTPAQPLRFRPVATATVVTTRPAAPEVQRAAAAPVVEPTLGRPSASLPAPAPASTPFAQMFSAGTATAEAGRSGYLSVPLQRRVEVDELQVASQPEPVEPAPTDPPGDSAGSAGATPTSTSSAVTTAGAGPAAGAGASAADLEELARRLYEPLSARIRAELWLDRERSGV